MTAAQGGTRSLGCERPATRAKAVRAACYAESFNGRLRDECLNESWFVSLADARQTIEQWRVDYNETRPHSGLAGRTPSTFAKELQTGTALHHLTGPT